MVVQSGEVEISDNEDVEINSNQKNKQNWPYAERDPIRIDSDTDFHEQAEARNWEGNGSKEDPYIISRYEIDGSGKGYCMYIGNTTVHFELKNNYFHNAGGVERKGVADDYYFRNRGIFINNVENGVIANNTVSDNEGDGISFFGSRQNRLKNNTIINNGDDGIYLYYSPDNMILDNQVLENGLEGIRVSQSLRNLLRNNTASKNHRRGISIQVSNDNLLTENNLVENQRGGFRLYSSNYNVIKNNIISRNEEWGAYLEDADDNMLYHNKFINNEDQAYDDGNNNWDAGNPENGDEGGNYWSDYEGEDRGDGIGYESYKIKGDRNQDNYPWVMPRMVHSATSFAVDIENITASNSPIININNARDYHGNPLNGEYKVEIVTHSSSVIVNLTFSEGHSEYIWNEKNKIGEYEVNVTIDDFTSSDTFYVNPLKIEGDRDLIRQAKKEGWPGNGSENRPYIIDGYHIENIEHNYSVYFSNITLHFEFRNNFVNGINNDKEREGRDIGIFFLDVKNGKFVNNTIANHSMGINFTFSANNTLLNNNIKSNTGLGGFYLYRSKFNIIRYNTISNNKEWGVYIEDSRENLIYQNNFVENKNQAYDNGDNHWNDCDPKEDGKGGNYWTDYEDKDRGDGIGEDPYNISGDNNQDNHPWVTPKRGKVSFELNIENIQAGEKPFISISNAEDQYSKELAGDYKAEIIVNNDIIKTNLTFDNGNAEYVDDKINESGQYRLEILLYDVIFSKESENFFVLPSEANTIEISPYEDTKITAGEYLDFSVKAFDQHDNLITDTAFDFEWKNADIYGVFFTTIAGKYNVTVGYENITEQVTVSVETGSPDYIKIKPQGASLIEGESITYTAIIYDEFDNKIKDVTNETEWSISEAAEGSWAENRYTAEKIGVWEVTARYEDLESTALLRVEQDLVSSYFWLFLFFIVVTVGSILVTRNFEI